MDNFCGIFNRFASVIIIIVGIVILIQGVFWAGWVSCVIGLVAVIIGIGFLWLEGFRLWNIGDESNREDLDKNIGHFE